MQRRALGLLLAFACLTAPFLAADREWQQGIWREAKVERPRVLFSTQTRDPNSDIPRTAPAREIRIFIIETPAHRLELRQDATVDTPRIDVLLDQPVQFAVDKKNVYVKDSNGKEHRLSLRKVSKRESKN